MVRRRKVILDQDPGHDDAIAMIMAASEISNLEILGVTTTHGNIGIENTTINARRIADIVELEAPIAEGASRPLMREGIVADEIHGDSGLDGPHLPDEPTKELEDIFGPDLIIKLVKESDEKVTLVPTGPLTNIALALIKAPEIKDNIEEISLMGGGTYGNWSPSAEFNILVDPEAASMVFESGIPITQFGLDVTHQTKATQDKIEAIDEIGNPLSEFVVELLKEFSSNYNSYYGFEGAPIHDACAVAYLIDPDLFEFQHLNVVVETTGKYTLGETVVDDMEKSGREPNVNFALSVNKDKFYDLLIEILKSYWARSLRELDSSSLLLFGEDSKMMSAEN